MQIVLEVSDELKPLAEDLARFARNLQARLERLRAEPNADYAAVEKQLADDTASDDTLPPTTRPRGRSSSRVRSTASGDAARHGSSMR